MLEQIEMSIAMFVLGSVLTFFATRWSNTFNKIDSLEFGVQALLRDRLLQMHSYYKRKEKPIPQREIDSCEQMCAAYKRLGGNGYIEDIRHEIVEVMPHEVH